MSLTRDQLLSEACQLPTSERQEFIEDLRRLDEDDELSAEQLAELRRRVEAMKRGEMRMIDGEQAMKELMSGLKRP